MDRNVPNVQIRKYLTLHLPSYIPETPGGHNFLSDLNQAIGVSNVAAYIRVYYRHEDFVLYNSDSRSLTFLVVHILNKCNLIITCLVNVSQKVAIITYVFKSY